MPEHKILLDATTTYDQVNKFFSELDGKQRVRARSCDGGIELYVRGSSKWHLFTDSLRSARDVQKDYESAKKQLLMIFFDPTSTPVKNPRAPVAQTLQNCIRSHKHDFRANHFKDFFESTAKNANAATSPEAQSQAKHRIDLAWKDGKIATTTKHLHQQTIEKLVQRSMGTDSSTNAEIQRQVGEFSKFLTRQNNPDNDHEEIDYVAAENFAFLWKRISEGNTSKASAETEKLAEASLTEITSKITEQSIPARLNLQEGMISLSAADLIIVDTQSKYQGQIDMIMSSTSTLSSFEVPSEKSHEPVYFSLRDRQKIEQTKSAGMGNNALEISYDEGFPTGSSALGELYDKVGETIAKKISSRGQQSNDTFTVHMSMLNPSHNKPASHESSVALKAFVDATQQWLKNYPNLHIKVQLPQGISEQDLLHVYRQSRNELARGN